MTEWKDITMTISSNLVVWPGDPPLKVERIADMEKGHDSNLTRLNISAHSGTHMDAPLHFVKDAAGIDEIPLEVVMGEARIIEIRDDVSIKSSELKQYEIKEGERILLKTKNSDHDWSEKDFNENFVHLETEAAEFLAEKKIKLLGVDYLSISGYNKNETEVHQAILGAGIWAVEGLKLRDIEPGNYELICLPMKIKNSDGAPARVLVRPMTKG